MDGLVFLGHLMRVNEFFEDGITTLAHGRWRCGLSQSDDIPM